MAHEYDLVILGGGPGGYVAAIRAAQLGLKTAIVERDKLGGTCLHKGCIPTKSLLRSAEVYRKAKESDEYGVEINEVALNYMKVQQRKNKIVAQLYSGVQHLMKKGKIDVFAGIGRILGPSIFSPLPGTISVEMNEGGENELLIPKNVILATGSRPKTIPGLHIDGHFVMTSDEALEMIELPKSILIVGGGVIGIEWASLLADFGVDVTILEFASRMIPTEDKEISKEMERVLKKRGIKAVTDAKVLPETMKMGTDVSISAEVNGAVKGFSAERVLISVGRQANIHGIGLENTDIQLENGFIRTNEFYQTNNSHIYAIGDCIGGLQLAHVASYEGMTAVAHIANQEPQPLEYTRIPSCVYSYPEAAKVGLTEEEARTKGYQIKTGKFPFRAIGKALVLGEADGFVKMVVDEATNDVLGVHMIGPHVTDLIAEAGLARVLDATPWEIAQSLHPHPSLSEVMGEVAWLIEGKAIHG
ncbi:dihydrolipoyl dehydrogenase [Bacillus tuaregi]|uniref:dihydrolipoyl dehydrogenase n=1 Tax=Bacillus tuaregi TaxID=1816695 RepID=UPI0008F82AB3|nr:dihydrolipoyl dehydrogenase [Bacillus tuaregi]